MGQAGYTMMIVVDGEYETAEAVIAHAMQQFPIVYRDKTVLVKPNLLCAASPEAHITTHPSIVQAVVAFLRREGAREVLVGDIPGDGDSQGAREVARACGILPIAGGDFIDPGEQTMRVDIGVSSVGLVEMSAVVDAVDLIVNVPKFKTHCRTYITGAIKNMFGVVTSRERQRLHRETRSDAEFCEILLRVYARCRPVLNIVDAIVCMEGNGPACKDLRQAGKVIISDDGILADMALGVLAGVPWECIPTLACADHSILREGLRQGADLEGELQPIPGFRMPSTFRVPRLGEHKLPIFTGHAADLSLSQTLCNLCGICERRCPANAIRLDPFPVIERSLCIGCYCCHELCPNHAWIVS